MDDERITVGPGGADPVGAGARPSRPCARRPLARSGSREPARHGCLPSWWRRCGPDSAYRWWSATPRPRPRSERARRPATPTRRSPPRSGARYPGSPSRSSMTTGAPVAVGEVGRVRLRSPAVMVGYWGGPPMRAGGSWGRLRRGRDRRRALARRMADHRRLRPPRRGGPAPPGGPGERALHPRRLQRLPRRGRVGAHRPSTGRAGCRGRRPGSGARRDRSGLRRGERRRPPRLRGAARPSCASSATACSPTTRHPTGWSSSRSSRSPR